METLRLEIPEFTDADRWRWRLTDVEGALLADHEVSLDRTAPEYEGFERLDDYVRWKADPKNRLESESRLVAQVGRWIGEQVLGPLGPAMVKAAPVAVHVVLPPEAEALLYRPLELAYVGAEPLALQDVSLVFEVEGETADGDKRRVADRLRMLAVFSLPTDVSALALRQERYELRKRIDRIAQTHGKAIDLRVLQYGVTRKLLEDVLEEGSGWDVIHFSGHGLRGGLVLEKADGTQDRIPSPELVELLWPGRRQLKLVTLSSCESAAATAAETAHWLGLELPGVQGAADGDDDSSLASVARELCRKLDCAVLAMRFPVGDEFAIEFGQGLYERLLGRAQPLPRALELALHKAALQPGMPPLSVATPALYGPRAAELSLVPPDGTSHVFDLTETRLAGFPPEPERFVGRVGPMVRANAVLASESQNTGVLFHGMAGAGKTACALELAYRYEQGRFQALAWYKAPDEGHDITAALSGLAANLEAQLSGLKMVHVVDSREELERFLPRLTELLERSSVLLVLDNLESLLTEADTWRDERWRLLVEALVDHQGLSRVILTSRRRPQGLSEKVLIEPIHALSLAESLVLARQLPNLGALMRGQAEGVDRGRGRELVAQSLKVVQGHPKLIELAEGQAGEPAALGHRLEEAEQAWAAGSGRLDAFLESGESASEPTDYLNVLDGWTRGVTGGLEEGPRTLFQFLCCMEEEDRLGAAVEGNWADLWKRLELSGEAPDPETMLAPLVAHGLVEVEVDEEGQQTRYRIHPGVAETAQRNAGDEFRAALDTELAAFWGSVWAHARDAETGEVGGLVIRAGLSAAPYLLRLGEWEVAGTLLEQVIVRDKSPRTISAVLPLVRRIVEATEGTEDELGSLNLLARTLTAVQPREAKRLFRAVIDRAVAAGDFVLATSAGTQLANLLISAGRLDEALELANTVPEYTRRAGLGPWTQLSDEAHPLQILLLLGRDEEVLEELGRLRERMAELPLESELKESVVAWNVQEAVLDMGRAASANLGRWEDALALSAEVIKVTETRGAPILEVARTRFNDYAPLLRLGRLQEARALLLACRDVFEAEQQVDLLGVVFSALADLEDELGHPGEAVGLERRALRYKYQAGDPESAAVSHNNLAGYFLTGEEIELALAHRLAAAVIRFQTGSGLLPAGLRRVARDLVRVDEELLPASFEELCERVEEVEGVRFRALVERLPQRAATGEGALAEIRRRVREMPAQEVFDVSDQLERWEPGIATVVAAAQGNEEASEALEPLLEGLGETDDWRALVPMLHRIIGGERGGELLAGLDPVDTAIVQRTLDALAGRVEVGAFGGADALASATAIPKEWEAVMEIVVAAAQGNEEASEALEPLLEGLGETDDWRALVPVLHRIIGGERGGELLEHLDPTDTAITARILERLGTGTEPGGRIMTDESTVVSALRHKVERYLRQVELTYEVIPNGDLAIRQGSTVIRIGLHEQGERSLVQLLAPVAVKISNVDLELTRFLLEKNNELLFGKFSLDTANQTVWYEHALLGDSLDQDELVGAIAAVAMTADEYDEQVAEMARGKRFVDV